jgi:L-rhamnose mutarotase
MIPKEETMRRYGRVIGLKPEGVVLYERLHSDPWPDVVAALQRAGIDNFTIYRYRNLLFSYFEYHGNDLAADEARMAADPRVKEWLELCNPLQEPLAERQPDEWWMVIPEVYHSD